MAAGGAGILATTMLSALTSNASAFGGSVRAYACEQPMPTAEIFGTSLSMAVIMFFAAGGISPYLTAVITTLFGKPN